MTVGVPKETAPGERRVALVPDVVRRLKGKGVDVVVEAGAGAEALIPDRLYEDAGATIGDPWSADLVAKVAPPTPDEVARLQGDTVLVGFLAPLASPESTRGLAEAGITAFAMEAIPRISRAQAMDALSSQSNVSGYKAALLGAEHATRFYPMLMTAAGRSRRPRSSSWAAASPACRRWPRRGGWARRRRATTSAPRSPSRSGRSARRGSTSASRRRGRAATPASSPTRSARSSSRRSRRPSRASTSSSRPRSCRGARRRGS